MTYGILDDQVYTHFLFLHVAIRILVSISPSKRYLDFADLALQKFVKRCTNFYGSTFNSYNIHGLTHLSNDVRQLGPLDSFSAFPYENNMAIFKKYCRKPAFPLQQIYNRIAEMEAHGTVKHSNINSSIHVSKEHNAGPLPCNVLLKCYQYRKIIFNEISLTLDIRDNCCILHDGSICIVINIFFTDDIYYLVVKKFLEIDKFYDVGIPSSAVHIYKCSSLSNDIFSVRIDEVHVKCFRMPYYNHTLVGENSSDEEDNEETSHFVIAAIIHNNKL